MRLRVDYIDGHTENVEFETDPATHGDWLTGTITMIVYRPGDAAADFDGLVREATPIRIPRTAVRRIIG